jgi:S-adenosylmethionine:tRNA ribosyltransferase-isomerase
VFSSLPAYIPRKSLIIFNDTRVVRARILFRKESGATIELFCLEPYKDDLQTGMLKTGCCEWVCMIGNKKKWKSGKLNNVFLSVNEKTVLTAELTGKCEDAFIVSFSWTPEHLRFSEIMEIFGSIPLPPYINRPAAETDKQSYQTVYAQHDGSIAAPTAGLHFTPKIFEQLKGSNNLIDYVTLHVGAGTFKPVSVEDASKHIMHSEQVLIKKTLILNLLRNKDRKITAVGTTSVRTLESLYWFGVKLHLNETFNFIIEQWDPYQFVSHEEISREQALLSVIKNMHEQGTDYITGYTRLMIVPGYRFMMVDSIITNFHLPKSSLLLLISAFLGNDWKKVYEYALSHDFRFLSYGDCCLFL